MFVSLKILNQYVKIDDYEPKTLADLITRSGIEVEGIHKVSTATNCVIGHVLSCERHPDADKLSLCQVDLGDGVTEQIVCGAPNVRAGQKVIVAKIGAVLPGDVKIKATKLRGVASNGMICSLRELGIENKYIPEKYQEGIYVLPEHAPVGADALSYLGLDDTVLELSLTPNRSDCLSLLGVAYEVGAILNRPVNVPDVFTDAQELSQELSVKIESDDCYAYYAKKLTNVKIMESPEWLKGFLIASQIRPINNVVDITNFVMLVLGQPLHAFDANKIKPTIVVRKAKLGETLETLDGKVRSLVPEDLLITDGEKPIALAGVMGGKNSEIDAETTDVILESAIFAPLSVRQTYKRLDLRSESSIRFEKQVDPNRVLAALNMASYLMEQYAYAEQDGTYAHAKTMTYASQTINISLEKINRVLGINLTLEEVGSIFNRLCFLYTVNEGIFNVLVPSRRMDIKIEADLIEEVIRIYGYDHLNKTLPLTENVGRLSPSQKMRREIKTILQACGLNEVLTYALIHEKNLHRFMYHTNDFHPIRLLNPLSEDKKCLRYSLLHSLLEVLQYNVARDVQDVAIFEIGNRYEMVNDQPVETLLLAGAITGKLSETKWLGEVNKVDFYAVKGILATLFERLKIGPVSYAKPDNLSEDFHPGRTAFIKLNGETIGIIGQVHPKTQSEYDLDETYVFELNLTKILAVDPTETLYQPISKFPQVTWDMAIVVEQNISAGEITEAIWQNGGKKLKAVELFDVYQGSHVGEGKKSLAFSLSFGLNDRTLTEVEVSEAFNKILQALKEKFQAELRQ